MDSGPPAAGISGNLRLSLQLGRGGWGEEERSGSRRQGLSLKYCWRACFCTGRGRKLGGKGGPTDIAPGALSRLPCDTCPPGCHYSEIHLVADPREEKYFGTFESFSHYHFLFLSELYLELGWRKNTVKSGIRVVSSSWVNSGENSVLTTLIQESIARPCLSSSELNLNSLCLGEMEQKRKS